MVCPFLTAGEMGIGKMGITYRFPKVRDGSNFKSFKTFTF